MSKTELMDGQGEQTKFKMDWNKAGFVVTAGLLAIALLWLIAGLGTLAWLAYEVPLSSQDMKDASWLGSPTIALHFTTGPVGYAMAASAVLCGLAIVEVKNSLMPLIVVIIGIAAGSIGGGEASAVRLGILQGTIRVGCYVTGTEECKDMLQLKPQGQLMPMYAHGPNQASQQYRNWSREYETARKAVVSPELEAKANRSSIPGWPLIVAPLYAGKASQLKGMLAAQRHDVELMRNSTECHEP